MKIGIIGAGSIGKAFAQAASRAGISVMISNSRGAESLSKTAQELGNSVRAVSTQDATQADMVLLSVPWSQIRPALKDLPAWRGQIVLDATNPLPFRPSELAGRTSSQVVADLVSGARLVKAFNTLPPELLSANPQEKGGRRVIFFCGDDAGAKQDVTNLIDTLGFAGIDLGSLAEGGKLQQFPGGSLPALNLIKLD